MSNLGRNTVSRPLHNIVVFVAGVVTRIYVRRLMKRVFKWKDKVVKVVEVSSTLSKTFCSKEEEDSTEDATQEMLHLELPNIYKLMYSSEPDLPMVTKKINKKKKKGSVFVNLKDLRLDL